jgi:hypothetical protein
MADHQRFYCFKYNLVCGRPCGKLFSHSFVVNGVRTMVWSARCGKNTDMYQTRPKKLRTSVVVFGVG